MNRGHPLWPVYHYFGARAVLERFFPPMAETQPRPATGFLWLIGLVTGTYHFHRGKLKGQAFPNKAAAIAKLQGSEGTQQQPPLLAPTISDDLRSSSLRTDSAFVAGAEAAALEWKDAEVQIIGHLRQAEIRISEGKTVGTFLISLMASGPVDGFPSAEAMFFLESISIFR